MTMKSKIKNCALAHPRQFRVANQVFLEVGVERALTAQPGKRALGFGTEFNMRERCRGTSGECRGRIGFLDTDLNQFRAQGVSDTCLYIHAARDDEFRLGLRVGGEGFEQGDKVGVGQVARLAAEQTADVAARNAAGFGEVALVHRATFEAALKGDGEVAHGEGKAEGKMMNAEGRGPKAEGGKPKG